MMDPWKVLADSFVVGALLKCVFTPLFAIFAGGLWGPGAFLGGAIAVSTCVFGEFYFRDEVL